MGHKHSVRDTNAHFIIDQFTRQIKNDSAEKTTIVQYDHNSQRLTFEMPLYIDSHAMTLCDLIEIHYINISTDGKSQNDGTYEVNDIKAEGEKAIFTWLISQEATQLAGSLSFFIVFKCTENGVTVYRWGTEICKTLAISAGMDNGEAVLTEYPDILAQWKYQLFSESETAIVNVRTAEANALAAIDAAGEAKKQSVLDSIPDEYEALSALADQNHRNKAGAIVVEEEGESIVVNDASEYPLQNLKVFGRSTQDGTPTPDAPVDIVSVESPTVQVCGKNLFNINTMLGANASVSGNSVDAPYYRSLANIPVKPGKKYTVSAYAYNEVDNNSIMSLSVQDGYEVGYSSPGDCIAYVVGATTEPTLKAITFVALSDYISISTNAVLLSNIMIEMGESATEYEPYIEPQTVAISHALPGIPVSSGGNYTDENGQRWICDEVDLARGVYVKRIKSVTVADTTRISKNDHGDAENWMYYYMTENKEMDGNAPALCDRLANNATLALYGSIGFRNSSGSYSVIYFNISNYMAENTLDALNTTLKQYPLTFVYALATPIETPLSEAEISAFKALHTNKPNTTILNDAGAYMAVEYVADTKTYIDNKIKEMMEEVE